MSAGALLPVGRSRTGLILRRLVPEEEIIPGVSYWPVSTCNECPSGCGVKVRLREGNAVKIEGNPDHPVNRGGLCPRGQSALQALYSPARVLTPLQRTESGEYKSLGWSDVMNRVAALNDASSAPGRIVVVTRQLTGAMKVLMEKFVAAVPETSHIVHEPLEYAAMAAANKLSLGIEAIPTYIFDQARFVVSFGADILETWLSPVSNARGFAGMRTPANGSMGRLAQYEAHLSLTGANADERYSCPPGAETLVALAIASHMLRDEGLSEQEFGEWRRALKPFTPERASNASGVPTKAIQQVAERLRTETPSLAVAGGPSSRSACATALQTAVNLINYLAGNYGKTVTFDRTENAPTGTHAQLVKAVEDMEAGRVSALIALEVDPKFSFPQPDRWQSAMDRVPLKIQLASVRFASTYSYDLVLPLQQWLERWDMVEPRSGLFSLQQPVVEAGPQARHPGEIMNLLATALSREKTDSTGSYEQFLRERWEETRREASDSKNFDEFWKGVLVHGGCWAAPVSRPVKLDSRAARILENLEPELLEQEQHVLLPINTARYGDGRQTGRPWLDEMPDPITTVVWDNPILLSPATAKKWKCKTGDVVRLSTDKGIIESPVYVQPGTNDAVVAMPLGAASVEYAGYHVSADSHPLHRLLGETDKDSGALVWTGVSVELNSITGRTRLAKVQGSEDQEGRHIAQAILFEDTIKPPPEKHANASEAITDLYPKHAHPAHDWTMVIDLSLCIGCGSCAVACQAENNVMVVGKKECLRGRELAWLRIERFLDKGRIVFLPMLCQQCEHAPCETVCPVYAAVHSSEGLNLQVYNRCIGTRYCANNCPYKVRRFNWYTYTADTPLDKQFNPDISLRTRGIMEKCTFCVHRIRERKEIAKDESRPLRDGEVIPACAQSCPTGAIAFGDLNDPASRVSQMLGHPRGYYVFEELNTQPSVLYLKRVIHSDGTQLESL